MNQYIIDNDGKPAIIGVLPEDTAAFLALYEHQIIAGPGSLMDLLMSAEWILWLRERQNELD